jgi:hypothetical protein
MLSVSPLFASHTYRVLVSASLETFQPVENGKKGLLFWNSPKK